MTLETIFQRLQKRVFHPYLIPVYWILLSVVERKNFVDPIDPVLWVAASLGIVTGLILLARRSADRQKASMVLSFALILILFYAHFRTLIGFMAGQMTGLSAFLVLVLSSTLIFIGLLRFGGDLGKLNLYLNLLFFILILHATAQIVSNLLAPLPADVSLKLAKPEVTISAEKRNSRPNSPDIFLFLLDGYSNSINLQKYFHFDNNYFLKYLGHHPFYIATNSKSNYNYTLKSVPSMMSMEYLPSYPYLEKNPVYSYILFKEYLDRGTAFEMLQSGGYDFVNLSIFDIGLNKSPVKTHLHFQFTNSYSAYLLNKTIMGYIFEVGQRFLGYERERKAMELLNEEVDKGDSERIPKFVYYHSLVCHDPYYFGRTGQLKNPGWKSTRATEDYIDQIRFTNDFSSRMVGKLLKKRPNTIIILISDHGFRELAGVFQEERLAEGYSNFCAVYFPDHDYSGLYDSITPINVMRVVLNKALQKEMKLLPDKSLLD